MSKRERGRGRIYKDRGSRFWYMAYYLHGKQYRESTGVERREGAKDAEKQERKAVAMLNSKLDEVGAARKGKATFVEPQQKKITISGLLDALEVDYKLNGKDSPSFKSHLKPLREYFENVPAVDVSAEDVDAFITKRLATAKPATVNRSTQLLGQAYSLAITRKHLSSAPHIRHLSEKGNVRRGFFTDTEFCAVQSNLPRYLQDFARFGYLTGWRRGEIASLRWEDVHGDEIRLRPENSKNGCGRTVAIAGELAELIDRRKEARKIKTQAGVVIADLVFHHNGHAIVDIRKSWATACRLAGAQGRRFHDLRRTSVRNMVRAGVPEVVAMSLSGHKTRSVFDRYNITSGRDQQQAMERMQSYLIAAAEEEAKRQPVQIRSVQ
jgi:integrase